MKKILITLIIGLLICLAAYAKSDPNNTPKPNTIKIPEGVKKPAQLRCPVHGLIGNNFIVIQTDKGKKIHCKRCALNLISQFLELNLPELEVEK
jgi:hypothetical protein